MIIHQERIGDFLLTVELDGEKFHVYLTPVRPKRIKLRISLDGIEKNSITESILYIYNAVIKYYTENNMPAMARKLETAKQYKVKSVIKSIMEALSLHENREK